MKIVFNQDRDRYKKYQPCEFKQGECYINAFHNPEDPERVSKYAVGVYLILCGPESRNSEVAFAFNLRSNVLYSLKGMERKAASSHSGGFYRVEVEELNLKVLKR